MKKISKIIVFFLMAAILIGMTRPMYRTEDRYIIPEEEIVIDFPIEEDDTIEEEAEVVELDAITVSLRIEGIDANLYYNEAFSFEFEDCATVLDLLDAVNEADNALEIVIYNEDNGEDKDDEEYADKVDNAARVVGIAGITEEDFPEGSGWAFLINGVQPRYGIGEQELQDSDSVVFYFRGLPGLGMQYPIADFSGLLTDGVIRFTCMEPVDVLDDAGIWIQAFGEAPVVGALVTHNGITGVTDENGELQVAYINRRAGFHTLQIERHDNESGLPTVLRLAPGYTVFVPFVDTPAGAWYLDAVMFCVREGFFSGVGGNRFAPAARMRMEQLITVLARIAGAVIDEDVRPWYSNAVEWVVRSGVIGEAEFEDGAYVTRERFIYMLFRTISLIEGSDMTPRADITEAVDYSGIDGRFSDAVSWAVASGIIRGTGEDRLVIDPVVEVSRAVASQMIYNYFNYTPEDIQEDSYE